MDEIRGMLDKLGDEEEYGRVLRAKGILQNAAGGWFQFDYVPGEIDMREGSADYTGRLCVIGADLNEKALTELFRLARMSLLNYAQKCILLLKTRIWRVFAF